MNNRRSLAYGEWHQTVEWAEGEYDVLDAGIRFAVRVIHAAGVETCQSCQGGAGHAYEYPSVDLPGGQDAFAAVNALVAHGFVVAEVERIWSLDAVGNPDAAPIWRIILPHRMREALEARANEVPMFARGYRSTWAKEEGSTR